MSHTHVAPEELTSMAVREDASAAAVAAWSKPDVALVMSVLATHGPQAAPFVRSLADYQLARAQAGAVHASNYQQTGEALRAAQDAYTSTETGNAGTLGFVNL